VLTLGFFLLYLYMWPELSFKLIPCYLGTSRIIGISPLYERTYEYEARITVASYYEIR